MYRPDIATILHKVRAQAQEAPKKRRKKRKRRKPTPTPLKLYQRKINGFLRLLYKIDIYANFRFDIYDIMVFSLNKEAFTHSLMRLCLWQGMTAEEASRTIAEHLAQCHAETHVFYCPDIAPALNAQCLTQKGFLYIKHKHNTQTHDKDTKRNLAQHS